MTASSPGVNVSGTEIVTADPPPATKGPFEP
jgi:hypothetical protein